MSENVVKVNLWGKTVGYVSWDKRREQALFQYDDAYIQEGYDIAPFTMPIGSERSKRGLVWYGEKDKLYQGLPAMFADSLPDHWGNALFNAWLRDSHIKRSSINSVNLLSYIGKRAMGALEYEPAKSLGNDSAFDVDVQKLYCFAQEVLSTRETVVLTEERSLLWQDLIKLGTSPGGKRPKVIIAINPETDEVKSRQSFVPDGYIHYILKYDDGSSFPFAKMEYAYYLMAKSCGIEMMPSMLRESGGATHFLTQRFDRQENKKIHTQTLAAMHPDADSYDDLFMLIRKLRLPYSALEQQYLRMVFNVLGRNVDDHSKNFSFCMNEHGIWSLSPAYDITYAIDNDAPGYINRHSLFVNGKNDDITKNDLLEVAKRNDINDPQKLIDQVNAALDEFPAIANDLDVSKDVIAMVRKELLSATI